MADENPIDVLDLPHVSQQPSFDELCAAVDSLRVQPPSWSSRSNGWSVTEAERKSIGRYLTSILSSDLRWLTEEEAELITETASKRLSERSGRTGMSAMTRKWIILSTEVSPEVSIDLHEPPLTGDNLGLKTWASSFMLAKRIVLIAEQQKLLEILRKPDSSYGVLELGAGTGLVGIAAAALLKCSVVLTDLPEIVENLRANIEVNTTIVTQYGGSVKAEILDWMRFKQSTNIWSSSEGGINGPPHCFPCVVAADPLYDIHHAFVVPDVVDFVLSYDAKSRFILELPMRDEATEEMRNQLLTKLTELNFKLLDSGEEEGFDDWQDAQGGQAVVRCWWGVWGRNLGNSD